MTIPVDLQRSAPARVVADIDADGVQPGDVEMRDPKSGVGGYAYACTGCGGRSWLALGAEQPHPRWIAVRGDAERPETVTLTPSIQCRVCGWHGYLTHGVFSPC